FATGPTTISVVVKNGNITTNESFGVIQGATISGNLYIDANRNASKDVGEANYSGAIITYSGAASGSTTTDASGNYSLNALPPGNYTVNITVPAGYQATTSNPVSLTLNGNTA